jgi:alanyl-tRNA synthetase
LIDEINTLLNHPKDTVKTLESLLNEKNQLIKQIDKINQEKAGAEKNNLIKAVKPANGYNVLVSATQLPDADSLKKLSYELKNEIENLIMVLAADISGKPQIAVMIADDLVQKLDLHAGNMVKELAREIKGGGGGQPFFATAGGKDIQGLPSVVNKANDMIAQKL